MMGWRSLAGCLALVASSAEAITLSPEAPRPNGGSATVVVPVPGGTLLLGTTSSGLMVQRRDAHGDLVPGSDHLLAAAGPFDRLGPHPERSIFAAATARSVWVVWSNWDYGGVEPRAMRVGFDGAALDAAPVALAPRGGPAASDIACAEDQCLLLLGTSWVRVSTEGRLLDAAPRPLAPWGVRDAATRAATVRDGWVVAVEESGAETWFARIARDGSVVDEAMTPVSIEGVARRSMALGSNGRSALLTWVVDAGPSASPQRRVELFDSVRAARRPPASFADFRASTALWSAGAWTFTAGFDANGSVTRVSADGATLLVHEATAPTFGAVGGVDDGLVGVTDESEARFGRYSAVAQPLGPASPLPRRAHEEAPQVDTDGRDFIVSWLRDGHTPVLTRVNARGAMREIAGGTATPWVHEPTTWPFAMVFDGAGPWLWTQRFVGSPPTVVSRETYVADLRRRTLVVGARYEPLVGTPSFTHAGADVMVCADARLRRFAADHTPRWGRWTDLGRITNCSVADDGVNTRFLGLDGGRVLTGRVDRDGLLVEGPDHAVITLRGPSYGAQIARGAGVYMVSWHDGGGLHAAPLTAEGDVDPSRILLLDDGRAWRLDHAVFFSLSFNGAHFVAV